MDPSCAWLVIAGASSRVQARILICMSDFVFMREGRLRDVKMQKFHCVGND